MKVQFFFDDEPTEVDADLFNDLRYYSWNTGVKPEEGIDNLTGKFARVYKVYFIGYSGKQKDVYVQVDMLAAIANGEYEVVEGKEMKAVVINLDNGNEYIYTVPPERAVVDAYYQYGKHDFNTWGYDYSLVKRTKGGIVYCGSFAARCE